MTITTFLQDEWKKILATTLLLGFFLYFWIEGPFRQIQEIIQLDKKSTEYSIPKVVGEKSESSSHGTIDDAESHGWGHGLMTKNKEQKHSSGLISSSQEIEEGAEAFIQSLKDHSMAIYPELAKPEIAYNENLFYLVYEGEGLIYLESTGIVEGVRGYAGEVNIGLFISNEGIIHSIHHISSHETESYLKDIRKSSFYDQFEKMVLKGDHRVDAVSGATLTTEAIAFTASKLIEKSMPDPVVDFANASEVDPYSVVAELSYWWIVHISVIFLMFMYAFQKKWRKSKKGIIVLSLLSMLYIGFFMNNSFTYISILHPFIGTSVSSLVALYALFTLLGSIWGKNTYCKYICPFGNAQRLLLQISPKKTRKKFFMANKWVKRFRDGLTLVLIAGVLLGLRNWSNFELFPDLFGMDFTTWYFVLALVTILASMRYPMIWCRLLCPTGSVLDFITDLTKR